MDTFRLRIMMASCLLLGLISLNTVGQVWASVRQQPTSAINLLLEELEEPQTVRSAPLQDIMNLLWQDDEEAQSVQLFLPLVHH